MRVASQTAESRRGWTAAFVILLVVLIAGCQAPMEDKKGSPGEFCNGKDTQCRTGLVCAQGVCQSLNNSNEVCESVCGRFEQCEAPMNNCYNNCVATLKTWSKEVTETYRTCYEEDVSCQEIQNSGAPQNICYSRLELKDERLERCKTLRDTAKACLQGAGDFESLHSDFFDKCRRKGRTVSDERWAKATKDCEDFATGSRTECGNMFACINGNFPLKKDYPTSKPGSGSGGSSGGSTGGSGTQ